MLLPLFLACHTIEKLPESAPPAGDATDPCGDITVPLSAYESTEPVLADADADQLGAKPSPKQVHLSWQDDPSTSQAVLWRTDADTLASRVELGTDTSYGTTVPGRSFFAGADEDFGRIHEVRLCGLSPGTTYHYRVGGTDAWSEDRTFTTAPPPGEARAFRFGVAGDSRDNQAVWGQILAAMEPFAPDFYVFSGDAVDLGTNLSEWDAFFSNGEGYLDRRSLVSVHGNHEFNVQPFYALTAQPGNEQWFSLDYANAHLVVLNDTVTEADGRAVQAQWMTEDLAATSAPWRFAFHHIPAWSSCTTHGSDEDLQQVWSPVEEAGGVAIDFAGHNHNYERSHPLLGGAWVADTDGTTYVVSAGSGADLYGNDLSGAFTEVAVVDYNFLIVAVDGGTTTLSAYDLAGNLLDSFTTTR